MDEHKAAHLCPVCCAVGWFGSFCFLFFTYTASPICSRIGSALNQVDGTSSRLEILDRRLSSLDHALLMTHHDEYLSAFWGRRLRMHGKDAWMDVWMAEWAGWTREGKGREEKGREIDSFPAEHNDLHHSSHRTLVNVTSGYASRSSLQLF